MLFIQKSEKNRVIIWYLKFPVGQIQFRGGSFAYRINLDAFYSKKPSKIRVIMGDMAVIVGVQ